MGRHTITLVHPDEIKDGYILPFKASQSDVTFSVYRDGTLEPVGFLLQCDETDGSAVELVVPHSDGHGIEALVYFNFDETTHEIKYTPGDTIYLQTPLLICLDY